MQAHRTIITAFIFALVSGLQGIAQMPETSLSREEVLNSGIASMAIYLDHADESFTVPANPLYSVWFRQDGRPSRILSFSREVVTIARRQEFSYEGDLVRIMAIDSTVDGLDFMQSLDTSLIFREYADGRLQREEEHLLRMPEIYHRVKQFRYDGEGRLLSESLLEESALDKAPVRAEKKYSYSKKGELEKTEDLIFTETGDTLLVGASIFETKKKGRLSIERKSSFDASGKPKMVLIETETDKEGRIIRITTSHPTEFTQTSRTFEYDERGLLLRETGRTSAGKFLYRFVRAFQLR